MAFFFRNRVILFLFTFAFTCFLFAAPVPIYYATLSSPTTSSSSTSSATNTTTIVNRHQVSFFERCALNASSADITGAERVIPSQCEFLTLDNAECSSRKAIDTLGKVGALGAILFSGLCLVTHLFVDDIMKRNIRDVLGIDENNHEKKLNVTTTAAAANDAAPKKEEGDNDNKYDDADEKQQQRASSASVIPLQPLRLGCIITAALSVLFSTLHWVLCVVSYTVKCDQNETKYPESSRSLGPGMFVSAGGSLLSIIGLIIILKGDWGKNVAVFDRQQQQQKAKKQE